MYFVIIFGSFFKQNMYLRETFKMTAVHTLTNIREKWY